MPDLPSSTKTVHSQDVLPTVGHRGLLFGTGPHGQDHDTGPHGQTHDMGPDHTVLPTVGTDTTLG